MRLPNGYGSITKLKGNRRKPYMIRVPVGKHPNGHIIQKSIGYAETREDGLMMLAEYNRNPFNVDASKITLKDLFEKYTETKKYKRYSESTHSSLNHSFRKTKSLHNVVYREMKLHHMQSVIDSSGGYSTQGTIKTFFKHMDDYAHELDICNNQYSQLISIDKVDSKPKTPFSESEIIKLWENKNNRNVEDVLILLYTGFRVSEFLNIKLSDIDLDKRTIRGGNKTAAGKNRIVPIHSRILPIIESRMTNEGYTHLSQHRKGKKQITYTTYRTTCFNVVMDKMGMDHIPHETRHTFRSRLDSNGGNKVTIDRLMGHASMSVGERVYTHKTLQELRETIELLD